MTVSTPRLSPPDPQLLDALMHALPSAVAYRASDRLAMAHDASHYLLTPQAVITPTGVDQVATLLSIAERLGTSLTFRSGGTSLSGQAGTDQLLVDTRRHFRNITVTQDGASVTVQPGATVRQVNARLAPYGRKLGPDPASEIACTVGGVVANNSSGMACGTEFNSYSTLQSAVLVLPSGVVVNTADIDCDSRLAHDAPELRRGLLQLRDQVRNNAASVSTIRRLFSLKNTMGYSLNAFLDYDDASEILLHLAVGSEGTLAFLAEATFHTVPIRPHAATGLLIFPGLVPATQALPDLIASGAATIELMDAASLRVAQRDVQAPAALTDLRVEQHAALLIEYQNDTPEEIDERLRQTASLLDSLQLSTSAPLDRDPKRRAALWHIRKGLYATIAGQRAENTTALLEDVAVPVSALAATCEGLLGLFTQHRYGESVIFGHAKDGNIHFMLTEDFNRPDSVKRYVGFTDDMVDLVLLNGGTLKAEHGTGRIMAPFVRRQYGDELYGVMVSLKKLIDPNTVLNPGSILTTDALAHVANLKSAPTIEAEVDRCVECGYCEPSCPSKDLTLTPRKRIVLRRERAGAVTAGDTELVRQLDSEYQYDGIETCAADGMCQPACPVLIDTGQLVKRLRAEQPHAAQGAAWTYAAKHWKPVTRAASLALSAAHRLPPTAVTATTSVARIAIGTDVVPQWQESLPRGGARRRTSALSSADAIYFEACIGSIFGPEPHAQDAARGPHGVAEAFKELCGRAGIRLATATNAASLCCGTPWKSKGFTDGYDLVTKKTMAALWEASRQGTLPVVCDASSCTEGLLQQLAATGDQYPKLSIIDSITYTAQHLLPALSITQKQPSMTVHPTCSSTRMGINDALVVLANAAADDVHIPTDWGCCAFAGDRGLLHPELTASATAREVADIAAAPTSSYASTNRTCEIGMTRASGQPFEHILQILERATRQRTR